MKMITTTAMLFVLLVGASHATEDRNARQDVTVSGNFVFNLEKKVSALEKQVDSLGLSGVPDMIAEKIQMAMLDKSAELARELSTKEAERRAAQDVAEIKSVTKELVEVTKTEVDTSLQAALAKVSELEKKLEEQKEATETATKASEKKLTDFLSEYGSLLNNLKSTSFSDPKVPVFRMAKFHTYSWGSPWMDNNNAEMFGGVNPSTWSDGNGKAQDMNWAPSSLRKIFHERGTGDKTGLNACSEAYAQRTSTNGYMCMVMFRIKNTKNSAVQFKTTWRYTAYAGWSEMASVALNKQNIWSGDCRANGFCDRGISVDIPPGKTSTLIFSASSTGDHCTYNTCFRATFNAFNNLELGEGLEFVDDLDTAKSLV
jgi:hypothetical protein